MTTNPAPPAPPDPVTLAEKQARTWSMIVHLAALSGFVGIPFGHIVGPLVVWLIKKEELPRVDHEGKKAINFQISVTIYAILAALTIFVLIGLLLVPTVIIFSIVCTIVAAIRANEGIDWQYPLSIRFLQ